MGLAALVLAIVIAGAGASGSTLPIAAWTRTREWRFLLIGAAEIGLMVLGLVWIDGQVSARPPPFAVSNLSVEALTAVVAVLLLGASALPRTD